MLQPRHFIPEHNTLIIIVRVSGVNYIPKDWSIIKHKMKRMEIWTAIGRWRDWYLAPDLVNEE